MSTGSNPGLEERRARLAQHLAEHRGDSDQAGRGWAQIWDKGESPPWDRGFPSPALEETLSEHSGTIGTAILDVDGQPRRKRALVPGCGRGVDVVLLESFGYDAVGLEYSRTAVSACERYAIEHGNEYPVRDQELGKGSRRFVQGDFYISDWLARAGMEEGEKFDLIYDYTFFSAMDPYMRPAWALRMSQLLGPAPHCNLICLEFPTHKAPSAGGPPFSSPPEAYMEHLSPPGQKVPYGVDGGVRANPLVEGSPDGLERVAHFKPKTTHQVGMDENGHVTDYIAVWRHR